MWCECGRNFVFFVWFPLHTAHDMYQVALMEHLVQEAGSLQVQQMKASRCQEERIYITRAKKGPRRLHGRRRRGQKIISRRLAIVYRDKINVGARDDYFFRIKSA